MLNKDNKISVIDQAIRKYTGGICMGKFDQGTVIFGLRSLKYPTMHCYGVIITARCDIANEKVAKLYYLTAVDAKEWLCTNTAYQQAYKDTINSKVRVFTELTEKISLNGDLLLRMSIEDAELILDSEDIKKKQKEDCKTKLHEIMEYRDAETNDLKRRTLIKNDKKPALKYLENIGRGDVTHYCYLPQESYLNNGQKSKVIIVDFQEINYITIEEAKKIETPGIDYELLLFYDDAERERYKSLFWLEDNNDFVAIEGAIQSPWREHLMQRFSFAFTRVGIDGATSHDFGRLMDGI